MTSIGTKRLMVIAFHYPPDNSSTGVLRTLKFTRYLVDHGWCSDVISVPVSLYGTLDSRLVEDIPTEVTVYRTWADDARKLFGIKGRYPQFLAVPDRYWMWYFSASRLASRLLADKTYSAVYSTYPQPTAHLIGLHAKRAAGIPWIADFRDAWVDDSLGPVRRTVEGWLEKRVIEHADRVICNTPAMRRFYLERYAEQPASKFITIPNGYDEADFIGLTTVKHPVFEITTAGGLNTANRDPEPLLKGIEAALNRGWLPRERVKLVFLGCGHYGKSVRFLEQLRRYGLENITEVIVDRVPYHEALRRQARSGVVVVLQDDAQLIAQKRDWTFMLVPAKLYEYLRLGSFILVLATGEAIRELLNDVDAHPPIPPTDVEGIAGALRNAFASWEKPGEARAHSPLIGRYERKRLTAELAKVLDEVASPRSAG